MELDDKELGLATKSEACQQQVELGNKAWALVTAKVEPGSNSGAWQKEAEPRAAQQKRVRKPVTTRLTCALHDSKQ